MKGDLIDLTPNTINQDIMQGAVPATYLAA